RSRLSHPSATPKACACTDGPTAPETTIGTPAGCSRTREFMRKLCQPSLVRLPQPARYTLNPTLTANKRPPSWLLTGSRCKSCPGRGRFQHTRSLVAARIGEEPGVTSSVNLTCGLVHSETLQQPGVPPLRRRSDGTLSERMASEEATQIRGYLGVLLPSAATGRWCVGASHAH